MNALKILSVVFLLYTSALNGFGTSITLVKEIGDENNKIIIQRPNGVVVTKQKEIFVADSMQHYLAKFNWKGKLIKKIGQRGQGPSDFNTPLQLNLFRNRLYLHDLGNKRFMEIGLDLENPKYIKFFESIPFVTKFTVLEEDKFIYVSCSPDKTGKYQAINIMNTASNSIRMFFDQVPQEVTTSDKKIASSSVHRLYFAPVFAIDREEKNLLISFDLPGNPIEFFVYSLDGKCLDTFDFVYDKDYRMPDFIREGKSAPANLKYTQILIPNIFVYKDHYIVIISKSKFYGKEGTWPNIKYLYDNTREGLIFDKTTKKLKSRFPLPPRQEIFSLNDEGFLSTFGHDRDDNPVVQIFQLKL